MGGKSSQETTSNSKTQQDPWSKAIPDLNRAFEAIGPQWANAGVTANESNAFADLKANAASGNPYAERIGLLADDMLAGGKDRTGMVQGAYDRVQEGLLPYTTMDTNPYSNEAFAKYAGMLGDDANNRVKAQYEAAGYNPSTASFGKSVAEGVGRAVAPVWATERNNLEAQKMGAIGSLYDAGNTSAGLLSGMDQTALGNRQAGVGVARTALDARDSAATRMLDLEAQSRGLPLQNIAQLQNLIIPMAQLGGQSNTDSFSRTERQASPMEIAQGWVGIGKSLFGGGSNSTASGVGRWF